MLLKKKKKKKRDNYDIWRCFDKFSINNLHTFIQNYKRLNTIVLL
jgi:hypothetical protein